MTNHKNDRDTLVTIYGQLAITCRTYQGLRVRGRKPWTTEKFIQTNLYSHPFFLGFLFDFDE